MRSGMEGAIHEGEEMKQNKAFLNDGGFYWWGDREW